MAIWTRLTSFVTGGAVATAAADAMAPEFEPLKQTAWKNAPYKVLDAATAAELRAREPVAGTPGIDLQGVDIQDDAARHGVGSNRFDLLTELARTEPGMSELFALRRRGQASNDTEGISHAEFRSLLRRQGYTAATITDLEDLLAVKLNPAQVALAVVRSLLDSHGLLVGENDTRGGKIAATPVSPINPVAEAEASGIDPERLRVAINSIGLPMALDAAAQSVFRGIIERPDFYLAVAQGDTRPAWADAIFEHARQILSAVDYVNAHIRGYRTEAEMRAGAARHGMSQEDVDLLYLIHGRPAAPGQMATAAARGIDGPDGRPMDKAQFVQGIKESDIKTKYADMLWESRYLYPPLFQLTRLVQAGAIDADTARDWAVKDRYPPEVVTALHKYWSSPGGTTIDPHVAKAQTQLWTTTHTSYRNSEIGDAEAREAFTALGIIPPNQDVILGVWTLERGLIRKQLTPAQVKKAYKKPVTNPDTGAPWTRDDAIGELLQRGYSLADAETYLDQ